MGGEVAEEPVSYHRSLPLTRAQVEQLSSSRTYRQALQYVKSAHMTDRLRAGSALSARFHGSRGIYGAQIDLAGRELKFGCTCPLANSRDACKHVIALGVAWLDEPDTFTDLDLTLARLTYLPKSELITLIRQAASRLPEVIPLLDRRRGT
jgi:uncharacterized Zn finger protein